MQHLRPALVLTLLLTLITGVIYPLLITGVAQAALPGQANGSLIRDAAGNVVGSALIGQNADGPGYFRPRPSAAGDAGYDATASGGSNLGPTNKKLIDTVSERLVAYRAENGLAADAPVPADAVTASGSGLDPDITPANARLQAARVAAARGRPVGEVQALIERLTEGRTFGLLGEPRVNVLRLNLALDGRLP